MTELKAYFTEQLDRDANLVGTFTDADGNTVVMVLDDTPDVLAPHTLRAEGVKFVKCSGFSIIPPGWPDKPDAPAEAKPLDYINPEHKHRPAMGGISVGHKDISAGTLGGYVIDNVTGARMILSNNHVLANVDNGKVGDAILQPGRADGGQLPADVIGSLARFVPIRTSTTKTVDCAIAKMATAADVEENIINIGKPNGMAEPYIGQLLKKFGRTSEYSQGAVAAVDATIKVDYGGITLSIQDCIVTGIPSFPGDSGSLCVDFASNAAVGLLFAGGVMNGYGVTILCKVSNVARLLNITVPTPDPIQRSLWLDVSKWQGAIDFQKMKSRGVRGVMMKICQGASHVDPRFAEYYDQARAAGLMVGGYVFVEPSYSADQHLTNLLMAVGERTFDAPIALDCEDDAGQTNQVITACIQRLADRLTVWQGRKPMIYTGVSWWNEHVLPWSGWKEYPLWIAFWSLEASFPAVPNAWKEDGVVVPGCPAMWQFRVLKGGGSYFGVSSADIDMNSTYRSFEALLEPQEPPPPPEYVTLRVEIEGQGTVTPAGGQYPRDTVVSLQATPAPGWVFDEWILVDAELETNPLPIKLIEDTVVWATFSEAGGGIAVYEHNKGRVMVDGLRIRTAPGVGATITGRLNTGNVIEILETRKDASGNTWARIGYSQWACMVYGARIYVRYILEGEA